MKLNRKLTTIGLLAIAPFFVACGDDDNGGGGGAADAGGGGGADASDVPTIVTRTQGFVSADEVHTPTVGASVTLDRDPITDTVTAKDFVVKGLVPGESVTIWWVIFNDQAECAAPAADIGALCGGPDLSGAESINPGFGYAGPAPMGGAIVDANGEATFPSLTTPLIDASTPANPDFVIGNGLFNLMGSEIHVVIRTHGPTLTDATLAATQLNSLNGGCLTGEPNEGLCKNVQFAFFAPLE